MPLTFDSLLEEIKWILPKRAEIANRKEPVNIELSDQFKDTFPLYTQLINLAEVKEFTANGERFRVYIWGDSSDPLLYWFADMEIRAGEFNKNYPTEIPVLSDEIIDEHRLLLQNTGGIFEITNENEEEDDLTWAKNFMFSLSKCYRFPSQDCVYDEDNGWIFDKVESDKQLPINRLICFSEEANGNLTFYNTENKNVYLLLGDHAFDYVKELDGHPEYSFYTIEGIKTFVEYVELMASKLLNFIKKENQ